MTDFGGYTIQYEVAGIVFCVVLYLYELFVLKDHSKSGKRFRDLILIVIIAAVTDLINVGLIGFKGKLPMLINTIDNNFFFAASMVMGFMLIRYLDVYIIQDEKKNSGYLINILVISAYSLSTVFNAFFGFYFSFDVEGNYIKGPLYQACCLMPLYFVIISVVHLLAGRKQLTVRQRYTLWVFPLLVLAGDVIQLFFFPKTLLNTFYETIGIYVIFLALETPDYKKLMRTLEELEQSRDAERRANMAKSEFLARTSHEIRTPINAVIGMNEMILRESNQPEVVGYARDSKHAANILLTIINDILDVTKIESGKMEIVPNRYSLGEMIEDIVRMLEFRAENKKLDLILDIDENLPDSLFGDEVRVKQIITNLMTNAVKYTFAGSVTLKMRGERKGKDILLSVAVLDTGVGISKEDIPKLTQAFQRVNLETNSTIEGAGLGLNIATKLLAMMDSSLHVESERGTGSVFSFEIIQEVVDDGKKVTITRETDKESEKPEKKEQSEYPGKKILVVDDVPANLKVVKFLLKKSKLEIDTALSGNDCIEFVKARKYDLILLDHMMPEKDGVEVLHILRDEKLCEDTPVVVLTANAIVGSREEYLGYGFDDYLSKPVTPESLENVLTKYLK